MWQSIFNGYCSFLSVERSLSPHTIEAYKKDVKRMLDFCFEQIKDGDSVSLAHIEPQHIELFLVELGKMGIAPSSQARNLSAIKSFFDYTLAEQLISKHPAELIQGPKRGKHFPDVLTVEEIEKMIACIDHSTPKGIRTRALLETLYGSGLRVSELSTLLLSKLLFEEELLVVIGKGNKERIVPMSPLSIRHLRHYLTHVRSHIRPASGYEDFVFLNPQGRNLSRVSIFLLIKELATLAHLQKTISPHSLRHTFATHLLEGGADLRSIQQMLGHCHLVTTEMYTHLNKHFLKETLANCHPMFQ